MELEESRGIGEGDAGAQREPAAEPELFGTRPTAHRPHSLNLCASASSSSASLLGARTLDLLVGVGIGAAVMYYLDPEHGARRRASADGSRIVGALATVLRLVGAGRRDALGAVANLAGSVLTARSADPSTRGDGGRALQMPREPVRGELGHSLERPGLLEQM